MDVRLKDRYMGIILFLFGTSLWMIIPYIVNKPSGTTELGPSFFPKFIAACIMVLSLILIIKSISRKNASEKEATVEESEVDSVEKKNDVEKRNMLGLWVFIVMMCYVFFVKWLTFIPATIIAMVIIMGLMRVKKWYYYLIVIALILFIKFVFASLIYVPLP